MKTLRASTGAGLPPLMYLSIKRSAPVPTGRSRSCCQQWRRRKQSALMSFRCRSVLQQGPLCNTPSRARRRLLLPALPTPRPSLLAQVQDSHTLLVSEVTQLLALYGLTSEHCPHCSLLWTRVVALEPATTFSAYKETCSAISSLH
jgi:hypothetical protein